MAPERINDDPRLARGSLLARLLLLATMTSTFSAALVWIVLTPRLDNPVHWLCKVAAAAPAVLNLAAILTAARVWRRR